MVSKGLNYFSNINIQRALKFMIGTWIVAVLNYGKITKEKLFYSYSCANPEKTDTFPNSLSIQRVTKSKSSSAQRIVKGMWSNNRSNSMRN